MGVENTECKTSVFIIISLTSNICNIKKLFPLEFFLHFLRPTVLIYIQPITKRVVDIITYPPIRPFTLSTGKFLFTIYYRLNIEYSKSKRLKHIKALNQNVLLIPQMKRKFWKQFPLPNRNWLT